MKIKDLASDYHFLFKAQIKSLNSEVPYEWRHKDNAIADIIMIGGLYERWTFMKPLAEKLFNLGYRIHRVDGIRRNTKSIPIEAAKLKSYLTKRDINDAILITHSKGGLVALYYMLENYPNLRTTKLIAIAAPFSGSKLAKLSGSRAIRELLPESTMIKYLSKELSHKPLNVVSIYPNFDNHIWHQKGSILDFAENIEVGKTGHHRVLADEKLHKRIIHEVQEL